MCKNIMNDDLSECLLNSLIQTDSDRFRQIQTDSNMKIIYAAGASCI
jgi:hypothetical protein